MLSVEAEEDVAVTLGLILFLVYLVGQYFYPGAGYVTLVMDSFLLTALYMFAPPTLIAVVFFLSREDLTSVIEVRSWRDLCAVLILSLLYVLGLGVALGLVAGLFLILVGLVNLPLALVAPLLFPYLIYRALNKWSSLGRRNSVIVSIFSLILLVVFFVLVPWSVAVLLVLGPLMALTLVLLLPAVAVKLQLVEVLDIKLVLLIALPSVIYSAAIGSVIGFSLSAGLGFGGFSAIFFYFSLLGIVLGIASTLTGTSLGYVQARSLMWFLRRVDRYF